MPRRLSVSQIALGVFTGVLQLLVLSACGGGGGGGTSLGGSSSSSSSSTASSSSSSSSSSSQSIAGAAANVQPIIVDMGPSGVNAANIPYVSVKICQPGSTTNCQTIDHIEVDTGSYGLRIISSVLSTTLGLTQETSGSNAIVECTQFADGYSWGPVKLADVSISGESAASTPIQIIGDPAYANVVPADCSSAGGTAENTVAQFGANGILGVGVFAQDCGTACAPPNAPVAGTYYTCPASGACTGTTVSLAQQVTDPAYNFSVDNNGVIVELPAISPAGAANVSGSLVFGIGTQSNNALGNATVLTTNTTYGYITTIYQGKSYANSFIDSGSNGIFFNDSTITQCSGNSGFYCPAATVSLSAINQGDNQATSTVSFNIANANTLFSNNNAANTAFNDLGGTNSDPKSVDFGLSFFFGRNVYTGFEVRNATGPYFAY